MKPDAAVTSRNIGPIRTPILIIVGTEDRLLPLDTVLHDTLAQAGKTVRMEVYEGGYHDFVLGPQGQKRPDLPQGEALYRLCARRAREVGEVCQGREIGAGRWAGRWAVGGGRWAGA